MAHRALMKAAAILAAAVLAVWLLGMLPGVHHWRNGFGFVGALLLLVPTVANEVVKRQATRLEARRASLDDGSGRQLLEQELDLLEQHMQRHQRWHAWIYIAGVLLLALEFRLGL